MKKLIQGATRLLVLALGLGLASTGWATDYTYSNVDSDSLAVKSDGKFGTNSFSFQLNNPSPNAATADFPASGYVQLTSITIGARSDNGSQSITTATLTNDKTTESYTATVSYSSGNDFTAIKPDSWSRKEVKLVFGTDGVLVDTTATYTFTFKSSEGTTTILGYSVVTTVASGTQTGDWKPAMRIYGRTPSGSMEMPSSLIPSSGGMALPSTVTVADATGMAFANDSVTIGNSGIQIALASALNTQTVMVKAVIPSSSSRLVGWKVSNSIEAYTSYTGSQFEQHFLNNGSVYSTTYGTSAWTRDANEHWVAVSYDRGSDTSTYLDGVNKITNTSLKWSTLTTSKVTIGGTAYNTTDAATGMVIKDLQIYNQSLGSERVATVTAALNKGWTVNGAGTTLTTTTLRELPNHANVQAIGSLTVAADGTYSASGLTEVKVLAGGSFDIGTSRPTISGVAAGGTLVVAPTGTVSQQIEGYEATETLTVTGDIDGTVTLGGVAVTPVVAGGTATLTAVVPSNPSYTGDAWWWDYEFNGTVTSIGSDKGGMTTESDASVYYNNSELYFQQTPWRNASFNDKSELTAVMYCAPGNYANTVLVGFGSTTANDQKAIALVTGANPAAGEMKLVLTDGHNGGTGTVTELANLTAVGATTTKHLYAFVMDRITENETTKTRIRVYLDGKVKAIYKHNGTLTLSNGFQIGSLHGGVAPRAAFNTGFSKYSSTGDSGTLDFLRVINGTLTDGAMAALAEAYPYNSQYGAATRAPVSASASFVATDVWTQTVPGQAAATQNAPNPNTNVTLSKDGSSDVSVAINLTENSAYESLTLTKEAGASGSLKLTSGYGNSTAGKLVSAETSVLVDTTVPGGRVNLGVTSIADGITLTVDPFSPTGNYSIYDTLATLDFGGVYEDVVVSMALLGDGASVVLDPSGVATLAESGFTAELVYNPDNLSFSVAIDSNGVASWSTRNVPVPAQTSLPDTYAGTVTINSSSAEAVEIATDFGGGSIAVSSGTVELSGDSSVVNVSGSGTVQVTGSLAVSGTFANTLTLAGDGTVTFATLPASALTFGTWTGTVVLPQLASIAGDTFSFNSYGVEGSTVRVSGIGGGWLKNEEVNPTIDIPEDVTLRISDFSASFNNTFKALSGAGTFAVTYNTAIDTTSGSWYSNYSAYFLVKNVSNFTGSLSTATPGIAIGSAKPAYNTPGGKIYLTSVDATLAASATPVPETTVEGYYVKQVEGVYSLESFKVITFKNYDETVLQTISDARLGDTPAYTEATPTKPADAQYTYTFDAWDPAIAEVTGNATYTATYTSTLNQYTLTIPVVEHATAVVKVGGAATDDRTFDYGTAITIEWTAASGYRITAGATQTINSIAANTTADTPTVEIKGATVSNVNFAYGADYATATVTATVSGDATSATLSYGNTTYNTNVVNGTVTFENVAVTRGSDIYAESSYTITAKDGEADVQTTGGSGTSVAADTTSWFSQSSANSGAPVNGSWTTAVNLSTPTNVTDNTFTTTESTSSRVVLEFKVCFSSTSADDVSGEAQAAIKLGEVDSATTFMVLTNANEWAAISNAALPPDASETYTVVLTIDYESNTYGVAVNGHVMKDAANSESFPLAASKTSVQTIDFAGSGTLTSMKGDQVEGYMVVDTNGKRYPTIAAAIAAYNVDPTIGPLKVLHAGTAPSGWSIVSQGGIDILKKLTDGVRSRWSKTMGV